MSSTKDLNTLTEELPEQQPAPTSIETVLTRQSLGGLKVEKVADRERPFINMLVYGESGVGKTTLAGSASLVEELSPVLCIDIEGGTLSIQEKFPEIEVVRVTRWKHLQSVYDELRRENPYKTVILDSLTEIQKFSMYEIMGELIAKEPDRDPDVPSIREWGKNGEQTRKFVRAFRDLPCNTIFTALPVTERDPKTGVTKTMPSLSGKLKQEVAGFLDIVLYYYMKTVDGDMKRYLLTSKTDKEIAKDRSDKLPLVVEAPDMAMLYKYINGQPVTSNE